MHLHGFYFDVHGVGTGLRQIAYRAADVRKVVTENMAIGGTMEMEWTPERPGNWLLHCHLIAHVTPALRFWMAEAPVSDHAAHGSHDPSSAMAGLVMGIRVTGEAPNASSVPATIPPARQLTMVMRKKSGYWQPEDAYGFALTSGEGVDPSTGPTVPGPLLVLRRGEPVEITLKNDLPEETAVHWHGIELESQYDGVPGWSGSAGSATPAIPSGGSFRVRFTPPRAGTFMYHTHAHDLRQLASGLYGAIVVLEPGETFDPARDHVVLLGMEGAKDTLKYDRFPVVVNGSRRASLTFKPGTPNRLRLINITTNFGGLNVSVIGGNQPVNWRAVAKDGADLPESQRRTIPALNQQVGVGETYDFLVDPPPAGQLWIDVRRASGEFVQQVPVRISRD
jgi:FtsP/CotA-like multicopper oxidase with cupredoxin domain